MRVLWVSRQFPFPPHDGDVLPNYQFLRQVARRARTTMLLTVEPADPARRDAGRAAFRELGLKMFFVKDDPATGWAQARRCWHGDVPWVNRAYLPGLAERARQITMNHEWDIVHAEGILSAQHLPPRLAQPSLLMARDCLSLNHWRAFVRCKSPRELLNSLKIRWMERDLYGRFDRVLAISPTDRAAMERIRPAARFGLLPNGVDLEQFRPAPELEEAEAVAFTGAMDYGPNVDAARWLAREIWPRVRALRPTARLLLVGRDPVPELAALDGRDGITVTGRVERMEEWMARASVIVSPLRYGTGMKNKVLEGAAMGRAMVVTGVSLDDIDLEPGRDVMPADAAGPFAEAVCALLADAGKRRELGEAARRAIERHHTWDALGEQLWAVYGELAGRA